MITLQYYTLLRTHYYLIYQRLTNYSGTTNIVKINKGCMRTRKLSHLTQTAIESNGWIRKTLCNRLLGAYEIKTLRINSKTGNCKVVNLLENQEVMNEM